MSPKTLIDELRITGPILNTSISITRAYCNSSKQSIFSNNLIRVHD